MIALQILIGLLGLAALIWNFKWNVAEAIKYGTRRSSYIEDQIMHVVMIVGVTAVFVCEPWLLGVFLGLATVIGVLILGPRLIYDFLVAPKLEKK